MDKATNESTSRKSKRSTYTIAVISFDHNVSDKISEFFFFPSFEGKAHLLHFTNLYTIYTGKESPLRYFNADCAKKRERKKERE